MAGIVERVLAPVVVGTDTGEIAAGGVTGTHTGEAVGLIVEVVGIAWIAAATDILGAAASPLGAFNAGFSTNNFRSP